jgi:hypothetical protein
MKIYVNPTVLAAAAAAYGLAKGGIMDAVKLGAAVWVIARLMNSDKHDLLQLGSPTTAGGYNSSLRDSASSSQQPSSPEKPGNHNLPDGE